jgi:site-specific recombinase XerD
MRKVGRVKVHKRVPAVVSDDHLKALLNVMKGKTIWDYRDTAIVRVLMATGLRRAEVSNLSLEDSDQEFREIRVVGKGSKPRSVYPGPKTRHALHVYVRLRSTHKHRVLPWLWIAPKGRLGYSGIAQMLETRCRQAGIPPITPHQLRHTWAHLNKVEGVSDEQLMTLGGWGSLDMLRHYGSSAAGARAREAASAFSPGDRF